MLEDSTTAINQARYMFRNHLVYRVCKAKRQQEANCHADNPFLYRIEQHPQQVRGYRDISTPVHASCCQNRLTFSPTRFKMAHNFSRTSLCLNPVLEGISQPPLQYRLICTQKKGTNVSGGGFLHPAHTKPATSVSISYDHNKAFSGIAKAIKADSAQLYAA